MNLTEEYLGAIYERANDRLFDLFKIDPECKYSRGISLATIYRDSFRATYVKDPLTDRWLSGQLTLTLEQFNMSQEEWDKFILDKKNNKQEVWKANQQEH